MELRQKLLAPLTAVAGAGTGVWLLTDEITPQNVVVTALGLIWLGAALRGLVRLRDNALDQRGLLGWNKEPLLLQEMTKVSLRREGGVPSVSARSPRRGGGIALVHD